MTPSDRNKQHQKDRRNVFLAAIKAGIRGTEGRTAVDMAERRRILATARESLAEFDLLFDEIDYDPNLPLEKLQ